jgi:hypothetical protein
MRVLPKRRVATRWLRLQCHCSRVRLIREPHTRFQLTFRLFTTCRSRAQHGAGMSAPLPGYTFHRPRGKRRDSAALREMTCYLMASARAWDDPAVGGCHSVGITSAVLPRH